MRTYLKNWVVLKSITDLKVLHSYSDWDFTGANKDKKILPPAILIDKPNSKVVLTYTIAADNLNDILTMQDDVFLGESWMQLPAVHQIQIVAKEGNNITDDETVQTDRLWT